MSNPEIDNYVTKTTYPDLNEIAKRSHALSRSKGFWDGQLGPGTSFIPEKLMLTVTELSEACESFRKREPLVWHKTDDQGRHKPEGIASELADVVIRVADLAARLGIDLAAMVEEKHAYNVGRPYRHGKVC